PLLCQRYRQRVNSSSGRIHALLGSLPPVSLHPFKWADWALCVSARLQALTQMHTHTRTHTHTHTHTHTLTHTHSYAHAHLYAPRASGASFSGSLPFPLLPPTHTILFSVFLSLSLSQSLFLSLCPLYFFLTSSCL